MRLLIGNSNTSSRDSYQEEAPGNGFETTGILCRPPDLCGSLWPTKQPLRYLSRFTTECLSHLKITRFLFTKQQLSG
jgi:hypothetical protein